MTQKYSILMPDLGEGVVEGELAQWKVQPGDKVQEDDILAEVMTDKASLEIPSPVSGQIHEIKVLSGQTCEVGKPLAVILTEGGKKDSKESKPLSVEEEEVFFSSEAESKVLTNGSKETDQQSRPQTEGHLLAAPIVKRWAKEHGVDLSKIKGTGLSGRITLDDVQSSAPQDSASSKPAHFTSKKPVVGFSVPSFGAEQRTPLRGIRKKIALSMQESKNIIPHFSLMDQARVENLVKLREQAKNLYPKEKITYLSFVMKILYNNLKDFPEFNASIDDHKEEIVYKKYYNFGFAADTPKGLLVPVIKGVDKKSIVQISREIQELADKARNSKITADEMKSATITVTNIGSIAGQWATPIINPPQAAILGMYRMATAPVYDGVHFKPVKVMNFSITADHRLIDGAAAARFISQFIERVENPSLILLEN